LTIRGTNLFWLLPRASVIGIHQRGVQILPVSSRIQLKEGIASNAVTSGRLIDPVLERLHGSSRLGLCLLAFTRELNPVIQDESITNAPCSAKVFEGILKLSESKVLLGVNDASSTEGNTFGGVFELGG
jgi:hypothetical protein